jgi:hypothetical protein
LSASPWASSARDAVLVRVHPQFVHGHELAEVDPLPRQAVDVRRDRPLVPRSASVRRMRGDIEQQFLEDFPAELLEEWNVGNENP